LALPFGQKKKRWLPKPLANPTTKRNNIRGNNYNNSNYNNKDNNNNEEAQTRFSTFVK